MAKILIVEDEDVLRMLIHDTLEDDGHDIEESQHADQELILAAGANYFMSKPFSPVELAGRVKEICHA
jgi:DNA-binding response OmpR family regulator